MLAAPLVLDLVRWTMLAWKRGHVGPMPFLASYFKLPYGVREHDYATQFRMLEEWALGTAGVLNPSESTTRIVPPPQFRQAGGPHWFPAVNPWTAVGKEKLREVAEMNLCRSRPLALAWLLLLSAGFTGSLFGQDIPINYDESKVPAYTLPDPLVCLDGTPVHDAKTWFEKRRPEILSLFQTYVYGKSPGRPAQMWFETTSVDDNALGGLAIRRK